MVRYRSTGKEIQDLPEEVTPERIRELKGVNRASRMRAIQEIAQRKDLEENGDRSKKFQEAVQHFDARYGDLAKHQPLLEIVRDELIIRGLNAAQNGETLDWNSTLSDIGEEVRKRAGFQSGQDQDRTGYIEEQKRSRGATE